LPVKTGPLGGAYPLPGESLSLLFRLILTRVKANNNTSKALFRKELNKFVKFFGLIATV
jgi:hypothetical protein